MTYAFFKIILHTKVVGRNAGHYPWNISYFPDYCLQFTSTKKLKISVKRVQFYT